MNHCWHMISIHIHWPKYTNSTDDCQQLPARGILFANAEEAWKEDVLGAQKVHAGSCRDKLSQRGDGPNSQGYLCKSKLT